MPILNVLVTLQVQNYYGMWKIKIRIQVFKRYHFFSQFFPIKREILYSPKLICAASEKKKIIYNIDCSIIIEGNNYYRCSYMRYDFEIFYLKKKEHF